MFLLCQTKCDKSKAEDQHLDETFEFGSASNYRSTVTVEWFEKFSLNFFDFIVCNLCQSCASLTIPVPLWFITISLVFFYLCKVLFSGFLQFNSNFVNGQNNSKYHDCALLVWQALPCYTALARQWMKRCAPAALNKIQIWYCSQTPIKWPPIKRGTLRFPVLEKKFFLQYFSDNF